MNRAGDLCLGCGLCCNGVIFANGQLQPGDDARRLRSLGLVLASPRKADPQHRKFVQPCAAHDGCRCGIYADRPKYCREFECLLLRDVNAGRIEPDMARGIIRIALRRVDDVRRLLRKLGDADEAVALSVRFRRLKRSLESGRPDADTAEVFGELTLAVHDLNLLLSDAFYLEPRE